MQNAVLEFCDSNLEVLLLNCEKTNSHIDFNDIQKFTKQTLIGLEAMHSASIVHRDLKPENILLKKSDTTKNQFDVRIADVGSAKQIEKGQSSTPYMQSRYYRSPELIMAHSKYGCEIDIWSIGAIMFEMLTRTPAFPANEEALVLMEAAIILGTPTEVNFKEYSKLGIPK